MKKKLIYGMALLLAVTVLTGNLIQPLQVYATKESDVKVSNTASEVQINSGKTFICNQTALDAKVGTEMFITYTVSDVEQNGTMQHGLAGTANLKAAYPYDDGGFIRYINGNKEYLLKEGYTYFVKFTVTEKGFDYTIGCAKDDESEYLYIKNVTGKGTAKMSHMGIWFEGAVTKATLTDVHCYDRNGNDLGLIGPGFTMKPKYSEPFPKATRLNHIYTVTAQKATNLQLFNSIKTDSDKVYFEYTVASSESKIYQSGVILNNSAPTTAYGKGQYMYELLPMKEPGNGFMLLPGADYLIICENTHTERGWTALIQRTYKGETEWFYMTKMSDPKDNAGFHSLFYGEGGSYPANFVLKNVRCYDEKFNNLGIRSNNSGVKIEHKGEILDYSGCDGVYYSEEDGIFIALYADKTLQYTKGEQTNFGTYSIDDSTPKKLTMKLGTETSQYTYYAARLIDSEGKEYTCLQNYTITFVPGNGTEGFEQILSPENGYKVTKPEEPVLEGDEFLYWCTGDGKEFNFEQVMTKSVTLYAKWKSGGIAKYEVLEVDKGREPIAPYVAIGLTLSVVVVSAIVCISILKRKKDYEIDE